MSSTETIPTPDQGAGPSPIPKVAAVGLVVLLAGVALAFFSPSGDEGPKPAPVAAAAAKPAEEEPLPNERADRLSRARTTIKPSLSPERAKLLMEKAGEGQATRKLDPRLEGLAEEDRETIARLRKLRIRGEPMEAVDQMLPILQKHPEHPAVLYEMALTYRLAGNRDETRALLVRSCKAGDERACKQVQGPAPARMP